MLEQVIMDEAAKTFVAQVTTAGLVGAGKLARLIQRKATHKSDLPNDPEAVAEQLRAWADGDPDWAEQVRAALVGNATGASAAVDPPPNPFVDRQDLRDLVRERPGPIHLFTGLAGSGKTALTHKIAEDLADRFPGDRCYLDLDRFRVNGILRFGEAMALVLRQLGIDDVAEGESELATQYRANLATREMLLIIDNVDTAAELAALAPGWPSCLVLATTRTLTSDLELDYRPVALSGLATADALALLADRPELREMIEREPEAAGTLLGWFDNMPLAVKEIGVLLRRRIGETGAIAALSAEFEAAGITDLARLTAMRLATTVDALPPDAARAFPLLATIPGADFTLDVAAALFGTDDSGTRRIIEQLTGAALITALGNRRFRVPHFIAAYARERFDVDADRLTGYYLTTAIAADLAGGKRLRRSLIPEPAPVWSVRGNSWQDWLDHNREALVALVERFSRTGRDEQAAQLCTALENLVLSRKRYDQCLTAFEFGTESARRLGRPALLARLLSLQGRVCALLHLFDRARALLTEAASIPVDDAELTASIAEFTGSYHQNIGDLRAAGESFARAVDIDRRTEASRAYGIHARMLANVLVMSGRANEAVALLVDIDGHLTDDRNRSRVAAVRAKVFAVLGDLRQAHLQLGEARRFAEASGSLAGYREELDDIEAEIAFRAGDYGTARSLWGRLIQDALAAHHPKSALYQAKLNWLPQHDLGDPGTDA